MGGYVLGKSEGRGKCLGAIRFIEDRDPALLERGHVGMIGIARIGYEERLGRGLSHKVMHLDRIPVRKLDVRQDVVELLGHDRLPGLVAVGSDRDDGRVTGICEQSSAGALSRPLQEIVILHDQDKVFHTTLL